MIASTNTLGSWFREHERARPYVLLDGAVDMDVRGILFGLSPMPEVFPLYSQTYYASILDVSPYLVAPVSLEQAERLLAVCPGMLVASTENFQQLAHYFQQLLEVRLDSGEIVLFRFYDPIILDSLAGNNLFSLLGVIAGRAQALIWAGSDAGYHICMPHPYPLASGELLCVSADEQNVINASYEQRLFERSISKFRSSMAPGDEAEMLSEIETMCFRQAREYGFDTVQDVVNVMTLASMWGSDFANHPELLPCGVLTPTQPKLLAERRNIVWAMLDRSGL